MKDGGPQETRTENLAVNQRAASKWRIGENRPDWPWKAPRSGSSGSLGDSPSGE